MSKLSTKHLLAFAASCCERALPNYEVFAKCNLAGDPLALRRALDTVWNHIAGMEIALSEIDQHRTSCEAAIPDSDDYGTLEASAAQDAGFMILVLLELFRDPDPKHVVRIATFARDKIKLRALPLQIT